MPRLLVNSVEGAKLIPFAKGRLRALRAAGHKNITQRYKVKDHAIRVTINGAEEIIEITDSSWDYLVWPTSVAHPAGVVRKDDKDVPPYAVMTLTSGEKGLRRKENVDLEAGPHDWVSKDYKTVLTYNHGYGFRYGIQGYVFFGGGDKSIYRDGQRLETERHVSGAAIFKAEVDDGRIVERTVYASIEQGSKRLFIMQLTGDKDASGDRTDKMLVNWLIPAAPPDKPAGRIITHPVHFSGDGTKFVTVLSSLYFGDTIIDAPHYAVRGTITTDSEGNLSVSITETEIDLSLDVYDEEVRYEDVYGVYYGDETSYRRPNTKKEIYNNEEYVYDPALGFRYSASRSWYYLGVAHYARKTYRRYLVGLDLTPEGEELLIDTKVSSTNEFYTRDSFTYERSTEPVLFRHVVSNGDISTNLAWKTRLNDIRVESGYTWYFEKVEFRVNGETFYQIDTKNFGGGKVTTMTRVFASYPIEVQSPTNPNSYFTEDVITDDIHETVETPMTHPSGENVVRDFGIRGIDGRHRFISMVGTERPMTYTGRRPLKVILRAAFGGEVFEKQVYDGRPEVLPTLLGVNVALYSTMASRRPGEFVICLSADDTEHKNPKVYAPLSMYGALDTLGEFDREPLIVIKRKGKTVTPKPNKFTVAGEPEFRLDPIHLL